MKEMFWDFIVSDYCSHLEAFRFIVGAVLFCFVLRIVWLRVLTRRDEDAVINHNPAPLRNYIRPLDVICISIVVVVLGGMYFEDKNLKVNTSVPDTEITFEEQETCNIVVPGEAQYIGEYLVFDIDDSRYILPEYEGIRLKPGKEYNVEYSKCTSCYPPVESLAIEALTYNLTLRSTKFVTKVTPLTSTSIE